MAELPEDSMMYANMDRVSKRRQYMYCMYCAHCALVVLHGAQLPEGQHKYVASHTALHTVSVPQYVQRAHCGRAHGQLWTHIHIRCRLPV